MAQNEVEIEIFLKGAQKATKDLKEIGETGAKMAQSFDTANSKLGEGLSALTTSVGDVAGGLKGLTTAARSTGGSFSAMLGPIGLLSTALYGLYEAYRAISGSAQEAERAQEAMGAAAGDLQSKLEALNEKGVIPTAESLLNFTTATLEAQFAKELLQGKMEQLRPIMQRIFEATKTQADAQEILNRRENQGAKGITAFFDKEKAIKAEAKARQELSEALKKMRADQVAVSKAVAEASKQEKALEEQSAEATLARVRENAAKLESLRIARAEADRTEFGAKVVANLAKERRGLLEVRLEEIKTDAEALRALERVQIVRLMDFDQESIIRRRAAREREDLLDQETEKERAAAEKRAAIRKQALERQRLQQLALERQKQSELAQLRELELQQMKVDGVSALEILRLRYEDELALAGDNINKMLIAQSRFDLERSKIEQSAAEEQARRQKELTELHRKNELARLQATKDSINQQMEMVKSLTERYGAGIAEAAYSAAIMGESFSKAVGETLIALGKQSAVQALISTAEGIAALFVNPALAGSKFSAAAAFTAAAAAAGAAGSALGGGSGGGVPSSGGTAAATSPSGLAQTAPTPERERAESTPMVFNVNFSGAVIYDTQRAAEQALADRITNLQNRQRRGGPMRRG